MKKGIVEVLQTEMLDFTAPVIINNIPTIDGLLCSQRQIIWGMKKAGMTSDKQFYKMLKAGGAIFNYYVLGDLPLYGVMKNMGNNYTLYKYLIPKGSYGNKNSRDGKGSAPRYIECKLDPYSEDMLEGINKNAVTMKKNYDATENEPVILPSKIPNILTNGRMSIAVSEANKMPSHNMEDVCSSIISYIKTQDIEKSISILKCPDMITGGSIIYDKQVFNDIYKTGKGSFTLLGKYKYDKDTNIITIYEIPYTTYIENIEDELEKNLDKFSKELVDYHNGSDKDGLKLDLYLKKNTNVNTVIQKLRKYTSFESKFACNFTILDLDGKTPKLMSLEEIINKWIFHRVNCIKNEILYDIHKNKKELNKLYGLQIINQNLDEAIRIIRSSKTEKIAIEKLINRFCLNQEQAEYIATIRLININQEWILNKIINISELEQENTKLQTYYNSEDLIKKIIISQLEDVKKKYKKPRMTEIIYEDNVVDVAIDQLIEDYNTKLMLTQENYLKKIPSTSMRGSANIKLKEGDTIITELDSTNKSDILLFSNKQVCYKLYAWQLEDTKPSNLGIYLPQELQLDSDEKIIQIISTTDYQGYLVFAFANGKIAKIDLSSYSTKTQRSKLLNAYANESELINMFYIKEDIDILCKSSINKVLITNTSLINPKSSKNSQGNMTLKSKNDSYMDMCVPIDNIQGIEDMEYYKGKTNAVGSYLKKTDSISMI